ncbi:hypothetical protein ACN6AT_02800 [Streptomyces sp. JL4002]|uniref:hypothetical protein n=1 Tax=Streptomyces sp. JL4002 TaxID=3404781 RepID=UPI003B28C69C
MSATTGRLCTSMPTRTVVDGNQQGPPTITRTGPAPLPAAPTASLPRTLRGVRCDPPSAAPAVFAFVVMAPAHTGGAIALP